MKPARLVFSALVACAGVALGEECAVRGTAPAGDAHAPTGEVGEVWTVQRFQREFCGEDSLEPFNRTMFGIFSWCMDYIVDPFCHLYSSIIPKPLIKGIDNFSENLEAPDRICANLFMGEWDTAWAATQRAFINSTLGIGGLFDPAEDWFYIFESDASFSDTFTAWGIPAGPPLSLPFMPRASVRGHAGYIIDYAFDVKTWFDYIVPSGIFIGYSWSLTPNKAPVWRGTWESAFHHTYDRYSIFMPFATAMNDFNLRQFAWHYLEGEKEKKKKKVGGESRWRDGGESRWSDGVGDVRPPVHASARRPDDLRGEWREIPGYAPRSPSLDSMRALCFAPLGDDDFWWERRSIFNRDFSKSIDARDIVIRDDLPKATYSYVAPDDASDGPATNLVIIFPGIGTGRTAAESVAMAELLHNEGYAVVIDDSLFHHEHVRSVNRGILPANLTEDVKREADYIARILADLESERLICRPKISVMGWSMGGLTTAHLAAMDHRHELAFPVQRFIAINPPYSMDHALAPFASVMERSRSWSKAYAHEMFVRAAPSLYGWAAQDHPRYDPANPPVDLVGDPWDYAPNLTQEQADYLLGMTLRAIFPALVEQRHKIAPFPEFKSRSNWFYQRRLKAEIGDIDMRTYVSKYVPTCYDGVSPAELIATAEIRRLEDDLAPHENFIVLHTWNDPLVTDEDRRYLDRLLGKRITWFADGGHCGYFYTRPFRDELVRRLATP